MATLLTGGGALFIHVPKTGGMWVTRAMRRAGVHVDEVANARTRHPDLADLAEFEDRFRFAFVRHPLTWWQSYWRYRMERGWVEDNLVDSLCRSDDFNEFAAAVAERQPGYLSRRYRHFVGPPGGEIEFIGRYERLADDLVSALTLAGESFDEDRLRAVPPFNETNRSSHRAGYRADLAKRVLASETETVTRFYGAALTDHAPWARPPAL